MTVKEAMEQLSLSTKRELASVCLTGKTYFDPKSMESKLTKQHELIVSQAKKIIDLEKKIFLLEAPQNSYVLIDGSWFEDLHPRGAKMIVEGSQRFVKINDEKINLMDIPQSKMSFVKVDEGDGKLFTE